MTCRFEKRQKFIIYLTFYHTIPPFGAYDIINPSLIATTKLAILSFFETSVTSDPSFFDSVANVGKRTIPVPAVFNHEPGATTSRFARHENLYHLSSMARKCLRGFIERASWHEGLVDQNASGLLDNPIAFVECSRCGQRFSSTTSDCRLNVRGRFEEFSRIDGRLESFRVARNARFRDRDAGIPPLERGWGECRCREPKPQALSRATAALAPIAPARCPRLWFVVKKNRGDASATTTVHCSLFPSHAETQRRRALSSLRRLERLLKSSALQQRLKISAAPRLCVRNSLPAK